MKPDDRDEKTGNDLDRLLVSKYGRMCYMGSIPGRWWPFATLLPVGHSDGAGCLTQMEMIASVLLNQNCRESKFVKVRWVYTLWSDLRVEISQVSPIPKDPSHGDNPAELRHFWVDSEALLWAKANERWFIWTVGNRGRWCFENPE